MLIVDPKSWKQPPTFPGCWFLNASLKVENSPPPFPGCWFLNSASKVENSTPHELYIYSDTYTFHKNDKVLILHAEAVCITDSLLWRRIKILSEMWIFARSVVGLRRAERLIFSQMRPCVDTFSCLYVRSWWPPPPPISLDLDSRYQP